jgi:hypothetical protein
MAERDEPRTPNGCSYFNGRCFDRLEIEADGRTVYAYFRDGSEYVFTGLSEVEAVTWLAMYDAGCYFNKEIRPGEFTRIKGPG